MPRTALNDDVIKKVVEQVEQCYHLSTAARLMKMRINMLNEWFTKGADHLEQRSELPEDEQETIYTKFFVEVSAAQARFELKQISRLNEDESTKLWQKYAWLLERLKPELYAQKQTIDQNVNRLPDAILLVEGEKKTDE